MESVAQWLTSRFVAYEIWEALAVLAIVALGFYSPYLLFKRFKRWERLVTRFAIQRKRAVWTIALIPLAVRILTLPIYPLPHAGVHDEFGHLLIADTFAHFRVTNPPHPMWRHFESIYILHQPTYASYYPIGQGMALAIPEVFRLPPWVGVWLSVAGACALICWMLQAWVPPFWAWLGGLYAIVRFSLFGYWMHSYWGGAVPCIGGALVFGALPRVMRRPNIRDALLFGLGLGICLNTRPYETALLSIPLGVSLLVWMFRSKAPAALKLAKVAAPIAAVSIASLGFMAYVNWRVTGNALQMPYQLHRTIYGTPQAFYWQPAIPPGQFRYQAVEDTYKWQREQHDVAQDPGKLVDVTIEKVRTFWGFYFGPVFTLPMLLCLFPPPPRRVRVAVVAGLFVLFGILLYPFFFPHYAAPVAGVVMLVVITGLRRLRLWQYKGKPVGLFISRSLVLVPLCSAAIQLGSDFTTDQLYNRNPYPPRDQVIRALQQQGGKHLIFVRYSFTHEFHKEIVYNGADIDGSQVVFARDLGREDNKELLAYYPDRTAWLFEPDAKPPKLTPYPRE